MSFNKRTPKRDECITPMKCITFDKAAQDALPDHIKAKMKADREKARKENVLRKLNEKHPISSTQFRGIATPLIVREKTNELEVRCSYQGSEWNEIWNLQHVLWGFEDGTYFFQSGKR